MSATVREKAECVQQFPPSLEEATGSPNIYNSGKYSVKVETDLDGSE
jgi:hypothetical protein